MQFFSRGPVHSEKSHTKMSGDMRSFNRKCDFIIRGITVPAKIAIIGEQIVSMVQRILICLGILLAELVLFFLPLAAFFLIYIILFNPPWFREFLNNLDNPYRKA